MDNILSTLKGEYARTLILILIPGAIALEPFAIIIYKFQSIKIKELENYIVLIAIIYLIASVFVGFIIQDIGSRIEIELDKKFCKNQNIKLDEFYNDFDLYLFNKKEEEYIVTHYYRSMLVRMRFELHTCASIVILLVGSFFRIFIEKDFTVAWTNTIWFVLISLSICIYLLFEAKQGVKSLHEFRQKINQKFKPSI